jgi:colanic acid biosynthesis glycosyl transferase WcaI
VKLLILTNYFPPETGAAAQLLGELAESLSSEGFDVTVVTGFPRYRAMGERSHGLLRRDRWSGVSVLRVASLPFDVSKPLMRGVDHLYLAVSFFLAGLTEGKHDVTLVYSPPLPLGATAIALARLWGGASIVNVQDLFPRYAIDAGLMRNPALIRAFEWLEGLVYRRASAVVVHSEGNVDHVVGHGGARERTVVISNWADTDAITPGPRENEIRSEWQIGDKFLVLYSGALGYQQDLDTLISAAELLQGHEDILIAIVGEGVRLSVLMNRVKERGLRNVVFQSTQPWARYNLMLQASDLCPVLLQKEISTPGVPSKIYSIMAAGRPQLLSIPETSDAVAIVREYECGVVVPAGEPSALAEAIIRFADDRELGRRLGANGRRAVESHFSRRTSVSHYARLIAGFSKRSQPV